MFDLQVSILTSVVFGGLSSVYSLVTFHGRILHLQLETLLKLFPVAGYRNLALQCLTEVISVTFHFVSFVSKCGFLFFRFY